VYTTINIFIQVWCGNVQQDVNFSTCGRCGKKILHNISQVRHQLDSFALRFLISGDSPGESSANQGGIYDKAVIVKNYTAGSIIEVTANFGAAHWGKLTRPRSTKDKYLL
jgi:hypothetical protein